MNQRSIKLYLLNCFILTLPVLLWNIIFTKQLPAAYQAAVFWNEIPVFITYGENVFRTIVFLLLCLMPLPGWEKHRNSGWVLYGTGTVLYFISWLMLIYFPDSGWSKSLPGFMAPAYTPLIWLVAIGQIGHVFYFNLPFKRWIFYVVVILFLLFHNAHTYLVYLRMY